MQAWSFWKRIGWCFGVGACRMPDCSARSGRSAIRAYHCIVGSMLMAALPWMTSRTGSVAAILMLPWGFWPSSGEMSVMSSVTAA